MRQFVIYPALIVGLTFLVGITHSFPGLSEGVPRVEALNSVTTVTEEKDSSASGPTSKAVEAAKVLVEKQDKELTDAKLAKTELELEEAKAEIKQLKSKCHVKDSDRGTVVSDKQEKSNESSGKDNKGKKGEKNDGANKKENISSKGGSRKTDLPVDPNDLTRSLPDV